MWLLVCAVMDVIGLAALFLQLTPDGMPLEGGIDAIIDHFSKPMLTELIWFWPLVGAATVPVLALVFGVFCQFPWAYWLWVVYSAVMIAFRVFMTWEMRSLEDTSRNRTLLKDMAILSTCVLLSCSVGNCATAAAFDIESSRIPLPRRRQRPQSTTRAEQREGEAGAEGSYEDQDAMQLALALSASVTEAGLPEERGATGGAFSVAAHRGADEDDGRDVPRARHACARCRPALFFSSRSRREQQARGRQYDTPDRRLEIAPTHRPSSVEAPPARRSDRRRCGHGCEDGVELVGGGSRAEDLTYI